MPAPKRSKIGFTDYSAGDLNFVLGCTPISAGCEHCYARRIYDMFGKDFSKVTIYPDKLKRLLNWQPKPPYKRGPGSRPLAFVVDMGDLFHEDVPTDFIAYAFNVMGQRKDIDWLVLTKRAVRMQALLEYWWKPKYGPAFNIWPGVTIEDEDNLWRIRYLLNTPAAVRWVSLEPMLEPVSLRPHPDFSDKGHGRAWLGRDCGNAAHSKGLDWVVIGSESGPNLRPFQKEWAWKTLDVCRELKVPVFLKQDSGLRPGVPLLDRKGNEVKEWPR